MLTNDDLNKMSSAFATKEDLRQQQEHIGATLEEFRHSILEGQDKIYKELKDFREEQSGHNLRHDDVDRRLRKIESVPVVAHSIKK